MKIIIKPGQSGNIIVTIAIGKEYTENWMKYALPTWQKYCERHKLGLVVFDDDLISKNDITWKKPTWQKMIIGDYLSKHLENVVNVCYIDSDFIINYFAPNIFDFYTPSTIGLVSQYRNLPYVQEDVKRRIAFFRNRYYDNNYPLDSALFMSLKQIFEFHNLPVQKDYACAGLFIMNVKRHAAIMKEWFEKYDKNIHSVTGGGDECHFNYEVQNYGKITWLDYKFQAIWIFEMAWKYPFLYDFGRNNDVLIKECIEASLFTNYFLHFAGSWHESNMWKVGGILSEDRSQKIFSEFENYLKQPVSGVPVGLIKPILNK